VLHGLLRLRLKHLEDPLDPGYGFDLVRLAATAVGQKGAEAVALPAEGLADDPTRERGRLVARLADRMAARFGREHVLQIVAGDTHVPEQAATLACVAAATADEPVALPEALRAPGVSFDGLGPLRRQSLRISAAEGPERIAVPWWSAQQARGGFDALPRDYYRVSDESGRRLWIFREGIYAQPPDRVPRWFVHGLFA
jgi:protein ImuB